jgi:hypothetical protein
MEQSLSWEADSYSPSQEIQRLLYKLKVHYRIDKGSTWAPIPTLFTCYLL